MTMNSSLRFSHEPEHDFELMGIFRIIAIIQAVAEILTIFHSCYVLCIFLRVKTCHINLRTICCFFLINLITKAISNLIILAKFVTGKTIVWEPVGYFIVDFANWVLNALYYFYPISFFVERSASLMWAKNYETFYSRTFLMSLCFFPIIISVYLTVHCFFLYNWVPIVYVYIITNSLLITCWTVYLIIFLITKRYSKITFNQSLSEKYQRYENLKTNKLMFWFAIVSWTSIILATFYVQFFAHYKSFFPNLSEINMDAISRNALNAAQAYIFLVLPVSFTFTHSKVKAKYLEIFKPFKKSTRVAASTSLPQVQSILGRNLVCSNEQDHYFKMLVADWEEKLRISNLNKQ